MSNCLEAGGAAKKRRFVAEDGARDDAAEDDEEGEGHPAAMLLDYLPGEDGDDPLMAIVAQLILLKLEECASIGQLPVSLEDIGGELEGRGIHPDEVIEALEWLLEKAEIVEVDEDKFAPN